MDDKKKRPKTAVLAFMQGLQNSVEKSDVLVAEKVPVLKNPSSSPSPAPNRINSSAETQLYDLPSGKKCRFITKTIDSRKCIVWLGNARDQDKISRTELEALKSSISAQGQLIPALARPNKNGEKAGEFTHELIFGSRRLKACQELNLPIKIIEADLSDEDALYFMDAENASREDLSLYEKATIYSKWIEDRTFESADDLSKKLGLSKRWVNKLLTLLRIPRFIVDALPDLKDLTKGRAEKLFALYSTNPELDSMIQSEIDRLKLEKESYTGDEFFERILGFLKAQKATNNSKSAWDEKEISSEDGEAVLVLKKSKSGKIKIEINKHLSPKKVSKLLENIEKFAKKL